MGTICTNQNGRLFYYFYWNGRKIREGTGLPDTRENKKKLEAHLKTIMAEIEAGMFNEARYLFHFPYGNLTKEIGKKIGKAVPKDMTFRLYAESWLKENAPPVLKKSTYQDYTSTLNKHLYPAFGASPISEITESDLKIFRQDLRGLSAKRANNIFVPLKTIFKEAHRKGVIKDDPTEFIKPLKTGKTDIHPLSVQEINFLADKMPSFWSRFLTVALLALKWKDINL